MPFVDFQDGEGSNVCLYRRREHIDTNRRETEISSLGVSNPVCRLRSRIQNIQVVEMTDFNFPVDMAPTFFEGTTSTPGNNLLDVYLAKDDLSETLNFTVTMPHGKTYADVNVLGTDLDTLITAAMDAQSHLYFNTGNGVDITVVTQSFNFEGFGDVDGNSPEKDAGLYDISAAEGLTKLHMQFLFGTGPSRGASCELVLGFDIGVDTRIITVYTPPRRIVRSRPGAEELPCGAAAARAVRRYVPAGD